MPNATGAGAGPEPPSRYSSNAQAACSAVLSVAPSPAAHSRSRAASYGVSRWRASPWPQRALSPAGSPAAVGPGRVREPAGGVAEDQKSRGGVRSWSPSQRRWSRTSGRRSPPVVRPSAR